LKPLGIKENVESPPLDKSKFTSAILAEASTEKRPIQVVLCLPPFLSRAEAHEKSINFHKNPDSSEQQNAN
jgi:hypothetical protein